MKVESTKFHSMLGHVADGCIIVAPSGKEFKLVNKIKGWVIVGPDDMECSGYLPSASDVEYFVVNGLQSH
jgi:hypothetical protein